MLDYFQLLPLGLLLGAFGTLIGAGGGFLLVPILLLLYPRENPEIITSISLAVVFFNAASGSWAYARMGRIDYRSAALFSVATIPGAVLGAISTSAVSRRLFDAVLGAMLVLVALYLIRHPGGETPRPNEDGDASPLPAEPPDSHPFAARPRMTLGMLLSLLVGYVSSLLGIGGGIIHVPLMVRVLRFPIHIATATSHLILAFTALAGTIAHIVGGSFQHGWRRTIVIGVGVVVGAQLGARLSNRIRGDWIIRSLAIALIAVGARVCWQSVSVHAS